MRSLLFMLVLLPAIAIAQIYKHVDENGNVTFTDQPPADAKPVEIGPTNTTAPPSRGLYPEAPSAPPTSKKSYSVSISSPVNDTIIPRGPGNFSVSALVSPGLSSGDKLQLLMDGVPEGSPQGHSSWALTNVYRGTHILEVAVVSAKGKELAKSEGITVYVFRPSVNF